MPRSKLVPLNHYQHIYETMIEVTDLNYGNHMGNDVLVGIIHRARVHFLKRLGAAENDLGDGKTGIVLADLVVNYKGEGFLFDPLVVESSIGELQSKGFRMFHRIATAEKRLIALAETGIAAFDYHQRKVARIPEAFIYRLATLETRSDPSA
ncbi:MAG: thioesterase family protein [Pseudomonadota bacterium]|uniref:Thioesterase family protein n=1 Tax=Candidatus Desulfatibia profunda TaxID=2841695 RepID=A0A8J6NUZ8_9BACT|nr:thioesterase family protein [Candidatus Desulfatibia profunda]